MLGNRAARMEDAHRSANMIVREGLKNQIFRPRTFRKNSIWCYATPSHLDPSCMIPAIVRCSHRRWRAVILRKHAVRSERCKVGKVGIVRAPERIWPRPTKLWRAAPVQAQGLPRAAYARPILELKAIADVPSVCQPLKITYRRIIITSPAARQARVGAGLLKWLGRTRNADTRRFRNSGIYRREDALSRR